MSEPQSPRQVCRVDTKLDDINNQGVRDALTSTVGQAGQRSWPADPSEAMFHVTGDINYASQFVPRPANPGMELEIRTSRTARFRGNRYRLCISPDDRWRVKAFLDDIDIECVREMLIVIVGFATKQGGLKVTDEFITSVTGQIEHGSEFELRQACEPGIGLYIKTLRKAGFRGNRYSLTFTAAPSQDLTMG